MSQIYQLHLAGIWCAALFSTALAAGDWDYRDKENWDKRYPQFCKGEKQSPIDLRVPASVQDTLIKPFLTSQNNSVKEITLTLKNDGHKLELSWSPSYIRMGIDASNQMYAAAQLHWHWGSMSKKGSEHTVNGESYEAEGHLVFFNELDYPNVATAQDKPNGLAVLGTFYRLSEQDNPLFKFLEFALRNSTLAYKPGSVTFTVAKADFNLLDLFLPNNTNEFFRYDGSLTTPPCYESVLWTVFRQAAPISRSQLELLRSLKFTDNSTMVDNFRPPLALNPGSRAQTPRTVYRTFASTATVPKLSIAAAAAAMLAAGSRSFGC